MCVCLCTCVYVHMSVYILQRYILCIKKYANFFLCRSTTRICTYLQTFQIQIDVIYPDCTFGPKIRQIQKKDTLAMNDDPLKTQVIKTAQFFADLISRKLTLKPCFFTVILLADLKNVSLDYLY